MLPSLRTRSPLLLRRTALRTYSTGVEQVSANDPKAASRPVHQNVSATNAVPTSSEGSFDKVLVESVEAAEEMRTMQAPNRKGIWSRSQQPREKAMVGPRFEQAIMEDQVWKLPHRQFTSITPISVYSIGIGLFEELLRGRDLNWLTYL
jgi:NADH dehydrogenase (ubiquinone) Fe-S protein 6